MTPAPAVITIAGARLIIVERVLIHSYDSKGKALEYTALTVRAVTVTHEERER